MGYGDELMGSGAARDAIFRGRRVAFGDGKKIWWSSSSEQIHQGNFGIARPGEESRSDLEWIRHYATTRLNTSGLVADKSRWEWLRYSPIPGMVFLAKSEIAVAERVGRGFAVIEPRVKRGYGNKQWPQDRYREVAGALRSRGLRVIQFSGASPPVEGCGEVIQTMTFRQALAVLARAALYVGPEGGLHHGAAALGVRAVVIFGGWAAPWSTGYAAHRNLASEDAGCGVVAPCSHCARAMSEISVDQVVTAATEELSARR